MALPSSLFTARFHLSDISSDLAKNTDVKGRKTGNTDTLDEEDGVSLAVVLLRQQTEDY